MDDITLLEQARTMRRTLLRGDEPHLIFKQIASATAEAVGCNVFLVDESGELIARSQVNGEPDVLSGQIADKGSFEPAPGFGNLLKSGEALYNQPYSAFPSGKKGKKGPKTDSGALFTLIALRGKDKPLGAMLLAQGDRELGDNQLTLAEFGAAMAGIMIKLNESAREQEEARNRELASVAFESLSYSEVEAIREILKNIDRNESVVVASKIADSLGITRSVIVNALRKFESAGIIESRSLGMKGTFIRVKNMHALELVASRSEKIGHPR